MSSAPDPGPDNATLPTTALLAASMTERASSPWTGTYTSGAIALPSLRSAGTLAPYPYLVGHGGAFRAAPAFASMPPDNLAAFIADLRARLDRGELADLRPIDRGNVLTLARRVQAVTDGSVEVAFVDQGYTGPAPAEEAAAHGIRLEVVRLPEAKRGFVLLPRRWVVERSFGWLARFRRLARDYERLPETVRGLSFLAFACLLLHRAATSLAQVPNTL